MVAKAVLVKVTVVRTLSLKEEQAWLTLLRKRFMRSIRIDKSGCWIWTSTVVRAPGNKPGHGTPIITLGTKFDQIRRNARIAAHILFRDPTYTDLHTILFRNTCGNPLCVLPAHTVRRAHWARRKRKDPMPALRHLQMLDELRKYYPGASALLDKVQDHIENPSEEEE